MTYCLAIELYEGIVFAGDTRSNAGVDYVSSYRKLHTFETNDDRSLILLSAGSLATTQEVCHRVRRDLRAAAEGDRTQPNLNGFKQMFEVAAYFGRVSQDVQKSHQEAMSASGVSGDATFILGGQIRGERQRVFLIYPQGNFIEDSEDTPYFQIGENKYGKPILDRLVRPDLSLADAAKLALISLEATMRSNVTVGPPLDVAIYKRDSIAAMEVLRIEENDPYILMMRERYQELIAEAFRQLPAFPGIDTMPA
ncbi:MAG: 20S proteasome subunit A/B [Opitutales bacterium]